MAALQHSLLIFTTRQTIQNIRKNVLVQVNSGGYATKAEKRKGIDRKVGPKIDSSAESLAAKGFLRSQKNTNLQKISLLDYIQYFKRFLGTSSKNTRLDDLNKRFSLFIACLSEFQHQIPNSLLHTMETLEDVEKFYTTSVSTVTPYDKLKTMDLPPNMHVQYDYHRFHPDTDTKFGGITAFPRSSTIVSGLKYKGKYKGHEQRVTWPFSQ